MRHLPILISLILVALSVSVPVAAKDQPLGQRWIVELAEPPTLEFGGTDLALQSAGMPSMPMLEATAPSVTGVDRFDPQAPAVLVYVSFLEQRHNDFVADASQKLGRVLKPEGAFHHVANGLVLSLSEQEAQQLQALPGVRKVYRERLYRLQLSAGPRLIGAQALHAGGDGMAGVKGEGRVVGVIDSGINWNHRAFSADPADNEGFTILNPRGQQFGLCFRPDVPCNNKLIGVYDFTDDSTQGRDTDGHGTHVAGIAVGNNWSPGQAGVAPRANLISYRVCVDKDPDDDDDAGTCQGAAIVQALDRVVTDQVDVVNFSIGGGPLNPWSSTTAAQILNMRQAGISFVTSAGNNGPDVSSVGWPAEAPWVFAVGASTTDSCASGQVQIDGMGNRAVTYGNGPNTSGPEINNTIVRRGADFSNNNLGCQSFPAGAFNNAVALLERGDCTFETKVNNASAAGARAVLVFNSEPSGRICMSGLTETTVPSAMLGRSDGLELSNLIGSGSTQRVSFNRNNLADQVAGFSSRGPSENVPRLMKPNVVAPGAGIRSAFIPGNEETAGLSGTSMASPHVAGAIALLHQLRPNLSPAMATSMLETTAEAGPVTISGASAGIFDRGAGRIRVDLAARAGLYLPVNRAQFLAANPASGGDPGSLNLAGLVNESCGSGCSFSRDLTALEAGSWTVTSEGNLGVSVSPSSFSLQAGQTQTLQISITPSAIGSTVLQHGSVILTPQSASMSTQRLPIGVRSTTGQLDLPEVLRIEATSNRGRQPLELGFVGNLSEATFPTSRLVHPAVQNFNLPQDPNRDDPYDGSAGTRTFLVDVPPGTVALWAETTSSSATDIDLFVGRDDNNDGIAQAGEEQCQSITPDELERCVIHNPEPGQWWVVVQNWQASAAPPDDVRLELAVLEEKQDRSLTAFGPGQHSAGLLDLEVAWDTPQLTRGDRLLGAIGVSGKSDSLADAGVVPVELRRDVSLNPLTTVLFPGETQSIAIPATGKHDRIVFDVPPTASLVRVQVQGEAGVSGQLRQVPFSAIRETAPDSPEPAGPVLASGSNSAAGFSLTRSSNPSSGRYFVELENNSSVERVVDVTLTIEEASAIVPRFGLWSPTGTSSNPRDIAQGIEWQRSENGLVLWYSYDAEGVPVFYLATGPLQPNSAVWVSDLLRFTRGQDGVQVADLAGTVAITAIDEEEMVFSWRLNGGHGSDVKGNFNRDTCPVVNGQAVSWTGTWFTPGQDQGGSSVVITDNAQGHIRYYYDARGIGRWVLATDGGDAPLAEEIDILDFRGFCPNCDPLEVSSVVVGTYSRSFSSENEGMEQMEFVSRPPLDQTVSVEVPISKLSSRLACP